MPDSNRSNLPLSGLVTLLAGLMIAGCGGGGGGDNSKPDPDPNPDPATVALSGVAVDGYISGATIRCLDEQGAVIASTTSGAKGEWRFELQPQVRCHTIESAGGTDVGLGDGTTTGVPLSASTVYRARVDHLDPTQVTGSTLVVSPVTSLIAALQGEQKSLDEAQQIVRTTFGITAGIDPLTVDPIAGNDVTLFRAGNLTAAAIREISNGIADALAANGAAQEVSLGSLSVSKSVVMRELAALIADGNAALNEDALPQVLKTATTRTLAALQSAQNTNEALRTSANALPTNSTTLAVEAFAIDSTLKFFTGNNSLSELASTSAAQSQPDLRKTELIDALLRSAATVDAIPPDRRDDLVQNVRRALEGPADGNINLSIPCDIGAACGIDISVALRSYLEIANSQIKLLTAKDAEASGETFTLTLEAFRSGATLPQQAEKALSGVAVGILQSDTRPQIDSKPRRVDLGFSLVKNGAQGVSLSALVKNLGLRWIDNKIAITTEGASVIAAAKIGQDGSANWTLLSDLISIDAASLVSAVDGELRIRLEKLPIFKDVTSILGNGTFVLSAVIRDQSQALVLATRENSASSPAAVEPIKLTVQDKDGNEAKPLELVGPGFTGTVTLQ